MTSNPIPLQHGRVYHVYNRGVNREPIFHQRDNYRYFLDLYRHHVGWLVDTYAYCLMGNHFHLALRIRSLEELATQDPPSPTPTPDRSRKTCQVLQPPSRYFSNLFNAYARAFNRRFHRTGALFQRPFGRIPVTTDEQFATLIVYIHQNPQKHGFVTDYRDWPYSSYHTLSDSRPTRLDRACVLEWLGGRAGFDDAHGRDLTGYDHPSGL